MAKLIPLAISTFASLIFFSPRELPTKPAMAAFNPKPKAIRKKYTKWPIPIPACALVDNLPAKYIPTILYNV